MTPVPGPWVRSVGTALPPHWVDQETLIAAFREHWAREHFNVERLEELHRAVQVGGRYLALPLEEYLPLERFSERNDAWTGWRSSWASRPSGAPSKPRGLQPA